MGYDRNVNDDAVVFSNPAVIKIPNDNDYVFMVSGDQTDSDTVTNVNNFKKNPGVGGLSLISTNDPAPGGVVTLSNSSGQQVGSSTIDQDGWYQITYKHTGKAARFTVKIVRGSFQETKTVELKANAFFQVDFVIP